LLPGWYHLLLHWLYAGNGRSISQYQPYMALYRFYRCPFASDNVWHYLLLLMGLYLRHCSTSHGKGGTTDHNWCTLLAGVDRIDVLYNSADVWQHPERADVDGRQTFYRQR